MICDVGSAFGAPWFATKRTPLWCVWYPLVGPVCKAKWLCRSMRRGFFDDFVMQFDHGLAEYVQDGRPAGGEVVVPPPPFPFSHSDFRSQPAVALQTLEERIQRARADVVAVPAQLGKDPLTDHRMLRGVVEDVDLPEAQQDLSRQQFGIQGRHESHLDVVTTMLVNENESIGDLAGWIM